MAKTPSKAVATKTPSTALVAIAASDMSIDDLMASMEVNKDLTPYDLKTDEVKGVTEVALNSVMASIERDDAYIAANESVAEEVAYEGPPDENDDADVEVDKVLESAPIPDGDGLTEVPVTKKKKEKKEAKPKVYFSKQSQRVAHQLGDKVSEFMLLEVGDALLEDEALKAKNEEVLALFDATSTAKKVGEKATMLFKWMSKGGELNEVMARAFKLLVKDGELASGDKGNLQLDLLAKPFSSGTARSQGNQIFMLFPLLKITMKEKGKMVANPDSLILMKAKAQLGL